MRKTYAELKLAVARLCNDIKPKTQTLAGQFLNHINEKLQRENNWSFLIQHAGEVTPLVAGTHTYDTPSNFKTVNFVYYPDTDGSSITIPPISDDLYFENIDEADPDTPVCYRLLSLGDNHQLRIQFGPPPSSSFINTYGSKIYIEQHEVVTALTEEGQYPDWPGEFSILLEFGAGYLLAIKQGDPGAIGFKAVYEEELKDIIAEDRLRYKHLFALKPESSAAAIPWAGSARTDYR